MQSEAFVDGVLNFREVAGLATSDGRRLRSGLLYRSGSYAGITKTGVGQLAALGITQVVDLRNLRERAAFGFDRIEAAGVLVAGIRHSLELGELAAILRAEAATAADVVRIMEDTYRKLPGYFAEIYGEVFRTCLTHIGPVAVNCSVGKDRTGVAIALLLSALGIPREAIIAEYALTNAQADAIRAHLRGRTRGRIYATLSDEKLAAVLRADPRYLTAMFDAVEAAAGSAKGFVTDILGLDAAALARLEARFLTP